MPFFLYCSPPAPRAGLDPALGDLASPLWPVWARGPSTPPHGPGFRTGQPCFPSVGSPGRGILFTPHRNDPALHRVTWLPP